MSLENIKLPVMLKHSVVDYLRVSIIAIVILFTIFIVKMFGNRDENGNKKILEYNGVPSPIDLNK